MATSGEGPWFPRLSDIIDDALELGADTDPAKASERQLSSALRSYNAQLVDFDNEGEAIARIEQRELTVLQNQATFLTAGDTLAVTEAMIRIQGVDYPLTQRSFYEWQRQPVKGQTGRPTSFTLHYGRPRDILLEIQNSAGTVIQPTSGYGLNPYGISSWDPDYNEGKAYDPSAAGPQVIFWPVPDQSYELIYTVIRLSQAAYTLGENPDVRRTWMNGLRFGVAKDLALKYMPERFPQLERQYEKAMNKARHENRSRSDVMMGAVGFDFSYGRRSRRRRR